MPIVLLSSSESQNQSLYAWIWKTEKYSSSAGHFVETWAALCIFG